ncbi:MAG: hypothetical protein ACXAAH_17745 [Promethearchaeota archaeon]|jgi:cation transport ATPase
MSLLLPGLGFISGQTIGALIVLMSLKMFRTGFNLKDWGQLIIGVVFFLCGGYIVLMASAFAIIDNHQYRLTYVWTYAVSISLIYFLYFYFPKTKFYKDNFKIRKKSKKPSNKSNNEAPSLFTWIGALISDAVMIIFYLALFVGFVYLAVKLVKYFWYV